MDERGRTVRSAIVVVNFASADLLRANLVPLARESLDALIVVVDNYSSQAERAEIVTLADAEGWEVVLPDANLGFGLGMNAGVARATDRGAASFLLLNPDATLSASDAERLLARVAEEPETLLAPRVVRPDGSTWFAGADVSLVDGRITSAAKRPQPSDRRTQPWLSGACLAVSAALWQRVGGFADDYFLYWEDVDLSHRVLAAGGSLAVCDDSVATHAEGGTQQAGSVRSGSPKSNSYYYFNIRNRLLFAARNLPSDDLIRWRRTAVPIAWDVLKQGGRRQFVHSLKPLAAAARALRDGRRLVRDELRARGAGTVGAGATSARVRP